MKTITKLHVAALEIAVDLLQDRFIKKGKESDAITTREWAASALAAAKDSNQPRWAIHCLKRAKCHIGNMYHPCFNSITYWDRTYNTGNNLPSSHLLLTVFRSLAGEEGKNCSMTPLEDFIAQYKNWDRVPV